MIRFARPNNWIAGLAMSATCACSDGATPQQPSPQSSGTSTVPTSDIVFRPCDITTAHGTQSNKAECAEVQVPALRNVSGSRTLTLSLKRYRETTQPRGQLWLIAGGPGSAASDFERDAERYFAIGQGLELYFLDHRGTGRSSRLACPTEEDPKGPSGEAIRDAEWSTCIATSRAAWGEDLEGFSTTEAARDLGELIARTRHESEPVFIYSVSYGTYLTQRYLQLYPTQASGIVLDSICAPGTCDLVVELDRQFDRVGQAIFEECARDPICGKELGTDPWSRVREVSAALALGHCSRIGWSNVTLRQVLGMMVVTAGLRDYMPAVVRRIERCSESDVLALGSFQRYLSGIDTEANSFSQALYANIVLSELGASPLPTAANIELNVSGLYVSLDAGTRLASALATWPTYPRDDYFGKYAKTAVPLLMLHGSLDPQLSIALARPLGDIYKAPHQHFVEIPYCPHDTLTQSLLDEVGNTCGAELARQFLDDPLAPLDASCTANVLGLNFAGISTISNLLFDTDEPWYETL